MNCWPWLIATFIAGSFMQACVWWWFLRKARHRQFPQRGIGVD